MIRLLICGVWGEYFRQSMPMTSTYLIRCVLGELYLKNPILAGDTDRDQLRRIFTHCGPLNEDTMPGWSALPGFPDALGYPWADTVPGKPLSETVVSVG
jgi:hypothetical protein